MKQNLQKNGKNERQLRAQELHGDVRCAAGGGLGPMAWEPPRRCGQTPATQLILNLGKKEQLRAHNANCWGSTKMGPLRSAALLQTDLRPLGTVSGAEQINQVLIRPCPDPDSGADFNAEKSDWGPVRILVCGLII
jgi:hypothetical protein